MKKGRRISNLINGKGKGVYIACKSLKHKDNQKNGERKTNKIQKRKERDKTAEERRKKRERFVSIPLIAVTEKSR
jgi:hypothetical protein